MSHATTPPPGPLRLDDLPLWRLLVALDDAERASGPDSATVRVLARHVQQRLRQDRRAPEHEEGGCGD
jgi:hypothetical protein